LPVALELKLGTKQENASASTPIQLPMLTVMFGSRFFLSLKRSLVLRTLKSLMPN
jgi:hypothetical protein